MCSLVHIDFHCCSQLGSTPLYLASQEGHIQVTELLLQAGASVDQENEVRCCSRLCEEHTLIIIPFYCKTYTPVTAMNKPLVNKLCTKYHHQKAE